jgi:hypothetical protein
VFYGTFCILVIYEGFARIAAISEEAARASFADEKRKIALLRVVPLISATACLTLLVFALFASFQSWTVGTVILLIGDVYSGVEKKIK